MVAAPGSQPSVQWLPFILEAGDVAIVGPTYGEYVGVASDKLPPGRCWFADKIPKTARHVVVCQPNNPDGRTYPRGVVVLSEQLQTRAGGYLIVDEAFTDVDPQSSSFPIREQRVSLCCVPWASSSLAGMRVGFAVTDGSLAA